MDALIDLLNKWCLTQGSLLFQSYHGVSSNILIFPWVFTITTCKCCVVSFPGTLSLYTLLLSHAGPQRRYSANLQSFFSTDSRSLFHAFR